MRVNVVPLRVRPAWPVISTDIKLGEGVLDLSGRVIGTERHESRRIDNQLRGHCGTSQFYISLEDGVMRRFGSDRIKQSWNV